MSRHPLEEHFAECFVNSSVTPEQLHHIRQCLKCREELQQFEGMIALLRDTVRTGVDERLCERPSQLGRPAPAVRRLEHTPGLVWKWALAAAVVVSIGMLPLVFQSWQGRQGRRPASPGLNSDQDAAALMESINIHVSRDLPAPMEPLMLVVRQVQPKQ